MMSLIIYMTIPKSSNSLGGFLLKPPPEKKASFCIPDRPHIFLPKKALPDLERSGMLLSFSHFRLV